MKKLSDFIKEKKYDFYGWIQRQQEISNDALNSYHDEMFNGDDSYTTVCEMLKTHDYKKLINKLSDAFSKYIESFEYIDNHEGDDLKSVDVVFFDKNAKDECMKDDNLYNILDFFNYVITKSDNTKLYLEPKYSTIDNDLLKERNYIAYHFTERKNLEYILKNGLKIRRDKNNKREYPSRIYLYVPDSYDLKRHRLVCIQIIKAVHHTAESGKVFKLSDYAILKVDTRHLNFDFYRDSTMTGDAVFCYNNISPQYIKEIPIDILK